MNELMKKGAKVRITKERTLKAPGEPYTLSEGHTLVGELTEDVTIGKSVHVLGRHTFQFVATTAVQSIDGNKIHTKNSIWVFSKP